MGYTHYWNFKSSRGSSESISKKYAKAVRECQKIILYYSETYGGLSGYSAHTKLGQYDGIKVNGSKDGAHEDFILRDYFNNNETFNFCKTAQKPYDIVVVACLCILEHRLKGFIEVSSDGNLHDWTEGLNLAKQVLNLKTLQAPLNIRNKEIL